jgi:hypothetical protein
MLEKRRLLDYSLNMLIISFILWLNVLGPGQTIMIAFVEADRQIAGRLRSLIGIYAFYGGTGPIWNHNRFE